ncbi:16S rRNA (cytidine(1402)-2'-O)-methyltransferase [Ottowia thiooxydans]|uniref:16S rRNA (cytidine(1402)-2'-O)-methyltransferase n=1 Tax=Ottowia thiooxydans TaxID=219182 RepID=UPI00041FFD95|nr:16S rRNA (cytidine(1402)-2'-O)-methyltransferase [Ottowia thiooxydans]
MSLPATELVPIGKPSFQHALEAARAAAGGQHYPSGALYVVATPIGNLADVTLRALHVLSTVDAIACEDTRHTQHLLRAVGIQRSSGELIALHEHNEAEAAQTVISKLLEGQRVAYVSDAGTPAVSDPGARLVAAVHAAGLRAVPLPGASSVICVLSAAGVTGDPGFVFTGFLPSKQGERVSAVAELAREPRAVVLLEAPHRIAALAEALATLNERLVTVGRELTKQFEQIATMACAALPEWLAADPQRLRGEFALVLHPYEAGAAPSDDDRVLRLLMAELPLKTAVKLTAEITGQARNALYERALQQRDSER